MNARRLGLTLRALDNTALLQGLRRAVRSEYNATAVVVVHLAEMQRRGLHRDEGYGSLFRYCVEALHLSESQTYKRIGAARHGQKFPRLLDSLAAGKLHLSAIVLLGPKLTPDNADELIAAAEGKSKAMVEQLIASRFPMPDVQAQIRKLPDPAPAASVQTGDTQLQLRANTTATAQVAETARPISGGATDTIQTPETTPPPALVPATPVPATPAPSPAAQPAPAGSPTTAMPLSPPASPTTAQPRAQVVPLSATRYKLKATIDDSFKHKLEMLRDLLRHQVPDGDPIQILDKAMDAFIEQQMKAHFGKPHQPRTPGRRRKPRNPQREEQRLQRERSHQAQRPHQTQLIKPAQPAELAGRGHHEHKNPSSRYIPVEVRRAVFDRDGMRCTFKNAHGQRCTETGRLELDHMKPKADGGPNTADNLRLLCQAHNQLMAGGCL